MPKPLLLLVDSDARSLRVLRVSLEQAGYEVRTAADGEVALGELEAATPAMLLCSTALDKLDGYGLVRKMRDQAELRSVPVVFLTEKTAVEDRIRALELGVEHYLAKPVYVRELLSLVGSLVARSLLVRIEQGGGAADGVVAGSLPDLSLLDLLSALERGRATGVLRLLDGRRCGEVLVRNGDVIDASFERLRGEEAVFRALVWPRGNIEFTFGDVSAEATIVRTTSKLIDAALGYIGDWNAVVQQLPGLGVAMCIDLPALRARVGEIPDELQGVLQLLDGRHALFDVIDESPFDDLSTLQTIGRLYQEGLATAVPVGPEVGEEPRARQPAAESTPEGRRRTHPWLEEGDAGGKALAPDSGVVSEGLVAPHEARLDPAEPGQGATEAGVAPSGSGSATEPSTRRAPRADDGTSSPLATEGEGAVVDVPERDFDEQVANQAVDSLLGASDGSAGEPATERRVIVTAAQPTKRTSPHRTRTMLSSREGAGAVRAASTERAVGGVASSADASDRDAAELPVLKAVKGALAPEKKGATDVERAVGVAPELAAEGAEAAAPVPGGPPVATAPIADAGGSTDTAGVEAAVSGHGDEPGAEAVAEVEGAKASAEAVAEVDDDRASSGAVAEGSGERAPGDGVAVEDGDGSRAGGGTSTAADASTVDGPSAPGSSSAEAAPDSVGDDKKSSSESGPPKTDAAPSSLDDKPRSKRSRQSERPRRASDRPGTGAASSKRESTKGFTPDDEPQESSRVLGESGVSAEFFGRSIPPEEPEDDLPFSEPGRAPLTPEQQARRRRLMRVVGAVIGLGIAIMLFIFLRDPAAGRGDKLGPRPRSTPATTSHPAASAPTAAVTASTESTASTTESAEPADAGAVDAEPDAEPTPEAEDAGADAESLPEVADPLGEVRKLANSGRYHDAIPMARAAIKADADNAEGYMYLAEAYRALGKHAEMQAAYDDCVARATKGVGMWCPYGKKKK